MSPADVYAAAWQLIFDGLLYMLGYHRPAADWLRKEVEYTHEQVAAHEQAAVESEAVFARLAELTRGREDAALRIAQCIRELAYGDGSRAEELKVMVDDDAPEYREIFERCYWRPTEEDRQREETERRRR